MSKDALDITGNKYGNLTAEHITPEVGDIFTRIYETKVSNRRVTSIYKCCDGDCLIHLAYLDEDNRISEEVINSKEFKGE